jgi:hypothetical protein
MILSNFLFRFQTEVWYELGSVSFLNVKDIVHQNRSSSYFDSHETKRLDQNKLLFKPKLKYKSNCLHKVFPQEGLEFLDSSLTDSDSSCSSNEDYDISLFEQAHVHYRKNLHSSTGEKFGILEIEVKNDNINISISTHSNLMDISYSFTGT